MKTELKVGDIFRTKRGGEWEYSVVVAPGDCYSPSIIYTDLPKGQTIYQCVWKGDALVVRKTLTKREEATTTPMTDAERKAWFADLQKNMDQGRQEMEAIFDEFADKGTGPMADVLRDLFR